MEHDARSSGVASSAAASELHLYDFRESFTWPRRIRLCGFTLIWRDIYSKIELHSEAADKDVASRHGLMSLRYPCRCGR
jgi:hypothetical protein